MTMFAAELAATGGLRPDQTTETAADVLWLAMDVRNYDWLVRQRGWSPERFQRWYVDTVAAAILSPARTAEVTPLVARGIGAAVTPGRANGAGPPVSPAVRTVRRRGPGDVPVRSDQHGG